jgi:hypothetical protein
MEVANQSLIEQDASYGSVDDRRLRDERDDRWDFDPECRLYDERGVRVLVEGKRSAE